MCGGLQQDILLTGALKADWPTASHVELNPNPHTHPLVEFYNQEWGL
jgi:hypothetical protein